MADRKKSSREPEVVFKESEYSYCFNAAEPVPIWKDNSHDPHLFVRGELCTYDFDWKKEKND